MGLAAGDNIVSASGRARFSAVLPLFIATAAVRTR
jgi:hypothetical protein